MKVLKLLVPLVLIIGLTNCKNTSEQSDKANNIKGIALSESLDDSTFSELAYESYIYGMGPVAMYRYYGGMALLEGGLNALVHSRSFIKPGEKPGGSSNNDTYYSYGWFDVSEQPMIVHLPDFKDRYYVFQINDIYGYNFANVGNKLSYDQKEDYLSEYTFAIVGPNFKGELPKGVDRINSPGKLINILYRIRVENEELDSKIAHTQQNQTLVLPLSEYRKGKRENVKLVPKNSIAPYENVIKFGSAVTAKDQRNIAFFNMLNNILIYDPPHWDWDKKAMAEKLSQLGLGTASWNAFDLSEHKQKLLADAQERAHKAILKAGLELGVTKNGWVYTDNTAGDYGDNFISRAYLILTGAMYPNMQVSRYANAYKNPDGTNLNGAKPNVFKIHKDSLPPVTSFWSITLYSQGAFDLVDNSINRYVLSSESILDIDSNGYINIYIQNKDPEKKKLNNWLPAPNEDYYLIFRFYAPTAEIINLDYVLPSLE